VNIPIYQIDAFTSEVFRGNPAAVCPLENWIAPEMMQAIAAENNLGATAFFVRQGSGYSLRWFSPRQEIRLCGHGTLATAFLIFSSLDPSAELIRFESCSGELIVRREREWIVLDFPARPIQPCQVPQALLDGIVPRSQVVLQSVADAPGGNLFVVYETEPEVRDAVPNIPMLEKLHPSGVCVTAPGMDSDFVSRFFAPSFGLREDPVTGSTHCSLAPYWAERLKKSSLHAKQLSARGGELIVEPHGERVRIKGKAVMYMEGSITIEADGAA
jgi:PhzF family phenazine biosynthesis protein